MRSFNLFLSTHAASFTPVLLGSALPPWCGHIGCPFDEVVLSALQAEVHRVTSESIQGHTFSD